MIDIICMTSRLGASLFIVKLEHTYYPPRTELNDLFQLKICKWPEKDPMYWFVVTVPEKDKDKVEIIALECGLKIASGIPMIIDCNGEEKFPFCSDNSFSLENTKDHLIYKNDKTIYDTMAEKERSECASILVQDIFKWEKELKQEGRSDFEIMRILDESCEDKELLNEYRKIKVQVN